MAPPRRIVEVERKVQDLLVHQEIIVTHLETTARCLSPSR